MVMRGVGRGVGQKFSQKLLVSPTPSLHSYINNFYRQNVLDGYCSFKFCSSRRASHY